MSFEYNNCNPEILSMESLLSLVVDFSGWTRFIKVLQFCKTYAYCLYSEYAHIAYILMHKDHVGSASMHTTIVHMHISLQM